MDVESNLLFAVLALQAELIEHFQFWEALRQWAGQANESMADLLVERQGITPDDAKLLRQWLERKREKYGTARAALASCGGEEVPLLLEHIDTLGGLASALDHTACLSSELSPEFVPEFVPDNASGASSARLSDVRPLDAHILLSSLNYHPSTGDHVERYSLTTLHATGGMGRVWLARDAALGRNVALKELRPELADNPEVWSRFLQEARITGQLEHPGIVPVYELTGRAADHPPFYTMRFVEGRTLSEAAAAYRKKREQGQAGPLDLRGLITAFLGVCNAVGYAHSRGIVHCDLKGANVVLGDFGEVIVLDWGLAKVLEEGPDLGPGENGTVPSQARHIVGTPAYMAPEQAAGEIDRIGPRTDVYGLGAILYEILAGRPPFGGASVDEILAKVRAGGPPPPRAGGAGTPALDAICLRALAVRPEDRYASARELADDVDRWLADEPVQAYREPLFARLARWSRRHRPLVAGAMTLLATATFALAAGLIALHAEQRRTETARAQAVAYAAAADAQHRRAEANFTRARELVDEIVRRAGDTPMDAPRGEGRGAGGGGSRHEPGSGGGRQYRLRQALLADALTFYQGFLVQEDADAAVRREIGHAYRKIGDIYRVLGKDAAADRAYAAAATIPGAPRE